MACSSCGFENPEGSKFCVECGSALAPRCPSCAAEHRPGQKFCGECGTPLTGGVASPTAAVPAPAAVRKTVTVLFADLSGSTGFGERNDAEISRQVLARYHALLQETVDAHAGTVAKFMGDGMMATWGIPEVSEDDARRAVAAGVALQQRFEEFAADVERRHGEALALRVGINTGEIVIGEGDADLIGDALNVAARLEHAARPGHVLVGEETWRLTRADVGYEALGEVTVAGRAQPVAVFEVAVEADAEPEVAAPFVGRDGEMQRLVGVFDDARRSATARLTTVLGSPGVGKTRLSRELCARLAEYGDAASVELRCDRAGEATFAPVAQLIRDAAALSDDLDADAARTAIGTLLAEDEADRARVVDVLAGLVGVGPARSVEETFWGVRRLVEATAAVRPLVVVIDDIQWAEPLLLDLIEHLAEWVADAAVLLVGLARPELREVRPSLAEPGRPVAAVVVLDGLDASATEALAAGLLGTDRLPVGLVERLPASTDGNPLFVRELVRMLVDDQVIRRRDDGAWELTIDAEAVDVPPTIQSLLGARVERLPATEREVLEYASVVGAEFSLGALRELAGERAPVASLLESMRRKELVEPTGTYWGDEPVHRFHHVLIRDAAYRRLLKTTRAELHERVAVWTDRTAADLVGEHEAATAFHYEQAFRYRTELGTVDDETIALGRRAAELLTTAAQRALGRDDLASAGALSARALGLLPASDAAARADLLQTGCECLLASGNGAAAKPLVEELGASAGADPRLAAWAECYAAQLVGLTDPEGLVAADARAQAAAEALTELGDGSGQAKAHQVRAGLLARLGRVGDAELELDLALAAARAADDRRRVTAVLGAAPDAALFGPSPVARAGGRCLDVVRLLRITTASPAVEAASNRCQAVLESLRGRFDVSRSMLASARAALEELGLRHGIAQTELYAGMVEMIAGDPHAAIPPLRAAYEGLGTLGVGADAGQAAALLALALLAEGEVDEAELMAAESEALAGQNLKTAIGWRVARAEVLAARGDLAAGVALAEEAVAIASGTDLVIDHADACVALAALRTRAGDAAGAHAARADAKRLYEQKGATVPAERLDQAEIVVASEPVPAVPVATPGASAPSNAAAELLGRIAELVAAQRYDECGALFAEQIRIFDRRRVIGTDQIGRAAVVANIEASAELGVGSMRFEPIAVRGSTLALGRNVLEFGDWGSTFLVLGELGPDGLGARSAWFDEADLAAALAELDAWYAAGEGAEHAELVAATAAWFRAMNAHDGDAIRQLSAPDLVFVDHRRLGPSTLDLDGWVDWLDGYDDIAFEMVVTDFQARGPVDLVTAVNRGVDADGGEILWSFFTIGVFRPDGRATRIEAFAAEDHDAALARFEELTATPAAQSVPTLGNAAGDVAQRFVELVNGRSFDAMRALCAEHISMDDRRSIIGDRLVGPDAVIETYRSGVALGLRNMTFALIAIRGGNLALGRSTMDFGEWESCTLVLAEVTSDGLFSRAVLFDDGALAEALDELDAWYVEGEGAEHTQSVATNAAFFRALNRFDFDAMRALADPDFVYVDHRQLGTPPLDIESFIGWQEGYRDVENHHVVADLQVRGRVSLVTAANRAVDANGGEIQWHYLVVGVVGSDGRGIRTEVFAPEDRDAALARFDELSRGSGDRPPLENTASRVWTRVLDASEAGADDVLGDLVAPTYQVDVRTRVTGIGPVDRDDAGVMLALTRDQGLHYEAADAVVVRGDRLALCRSGSRTPAGDEASVLALVEVDQQGRMVATVVFDESDLTDAVDELDARYVAGEGAEHATWLTGITEGFANLTAGSHDHVGSDWVVVDHRFGGAALDGDAFVEWQRGFAGLEQAFVIEQIAFGPTAALAGVRYEGVDETGGGFEWHLRILFTLDESGSVTTEIWESEDFEVAFARFEELSRGNGDRPSLENTATRTADRLLARLGAGRVDEVEELLAPGMVNDDRRSGVSWGRVGRDELLEGLRASGEVGLSLERSEVIAVRGDRLTLGHVVWRNPAGDEISQITVGEVDPDGRCTALVTFDDDRLDAAISELDARYIAGEGAAHADLVRVSNAWMRAIDDVDLDALREIAAPGFALVDRRALGWPSLDLDGFIDIQQAYDDVRSHFLARTFRARGRVVLSQLVNQAVDEDGGSITWEIHLVTVVTADGRVARAEIFAEEDGASAAALFEELSAAPPTELRTLEIDNAAMRLVRRGFRLVEEGRFEELEAIYHPDLRPEGRRRVVAVPAGTSREAWAEYMRIWLEQFSSFVIEPVAVRGDRIAAYRTCSTNDAGDETVLLTACEIDASDRVIRQVMFDESDEIAAVDLIEEWHRRGEGAAQADMLDWLATVGRAMRAREPGAASVQALMAPDFALVDHRTLGYGAIDLPTLSVLQDARDEQLADEIKYHRTREIKGDAVLAWYETTAVAPDGGRFTWSHWVVWHRVDGLWARLEMFDLDDAAAARARFEELATPTRTPDIENASSRAVDRLWTAAAEQRFDDVATVLASDIERVDHRPGVALPTIAGVDGYLELVRASFGRGEVERVAVTPLAVRGERLSLTRVVVAVQEFEIVVLLVAELDDEGRIAAVAIYDDDLTNAYDALDARYAEIRTDDPSPVERAAAAYRDALGRGDRDAVARCFAPDFVSVDHRTLGFGTATRDEFLERSRALADATPDSHLHFTKQYTQGGAGIVVVHLTGTTSDGSEYDWHYVNVVLADAHDRFARMEYFPEDRWVDALARFDELATESNPRNPRAENAVTQLLARSRRAEDRDPGHDRGAGFAPDVSFEDRRSGVSLPLLRGADQMRENMAARDESFGPTDFEPVAVRGDHLALVSTRATSESGFELTSLMLFETDDDGRVRSMVSFDEDDLAAAIDELDDRYLAGEGAPDARVLSAVRAVFHATRDEDTEALGRLLSPALVTVDHQRIGFGTADRDTYLERERSDQQVMRRDREYTRKGFVSGAAVLVVYESQRLDPHGGEVLYQSHVIARVDRSDRIDRMEWFDVDDWDAALARFDELAAAPAPDARNPRPENAATRASDELARLVVANRLDEAERFFGDGYVRIDRRAGVAAPDAHGGRAFVDAYRGFYDVGFEQVRLEYVAVRGDRLHLVRTRFETADGREVEFLQVSESDESGLAIAGVNFDTDDLVAALEELDARYVASGAATDVEAKLLAGAAALNRRDAEAVTALLSPDLVVIDHSPLGFPPTDRDGYVHDQMQGLDALVPDNVRIVEKMLVAGDTALMVTRVVGTTTDGSRYEWVPLYVVRRAPDGRFDRMESFAPEDWDAALACFDELGVSAPDEPVAAPTLDNAAMRYLEAARDFSSTPGRDVDEFAVRWLAEDVVRVDRRTGVSAPEVSGRDAYADVFRSMREAFVTFTLDPVAIRGDRLALVATVGTSSEGFELPYLILVEVDDAGRARYLAHFDEDDLVGAMQELEDRYVAGEGAGDAYVVRRLGDTVRARDRRDWGAIADLCAPDLVAADHRLLPYPLVDRASFVAMQQGVVDLVPDLSLEIRTVEIDGDSCVMRVLSRGTSADGSHAAWEFWNVGRFVGGRIANSEFFDLADEAGARARFAELAAIDPRTRVLDNDAVRQTERLMWLARFDFDRSPEMFSPDVVYTDHRAVVALPTLHGIEAMATVYTSVFEVYDDVVMEPTAVRGERLALYTLRMVTSGGAESGAHLLVGLDEQGRIELMVGFDESQLLDAIEELERRDEELSGDADAGVERTQTQASLALTRGDVGDELAAGTEDASRARATLGNRATSRFAEMMALTNGGDAEGLAALMAPGFEAMDRRSVTFGPTTSGDEFLRSATGLVEVFDEIVQDEVLATRGERLHLTRNRFVSANGFDVPILGLGEIDDDGRILATVMFDEDDLVGAMQELEERYLAGEGAGEVYVLGRIADFAHAYRVRDWAAVSALFADDAVVTDHRAIGQGWSHRDDFVASSRVVVDLTPDVVHVQRELEVRNAVVLANAEAFGTTGDGNGYSWTYRVLVAYRGGRVAHLELFDEVDEARARARFEELAAADRRTPSIDNDAVRQMVRLEWVARFDRDRAVDLLSPDVAFTDRRSVVSVPTLEGVDGMSTSYDSLFAVYDDLVLEPVAVRGRRLALFRFRMSTQSGSESNGFMLAEIDGDGRFVEFVGFDDEGFAEALEELERRHEDVSDTYAPIEAVYVPGIVAMNRGDLEGWRATLSPEYRMVDHSLLGAGTLDRDAMLDTVRMLRDQIPGSNIYAGMWIAGGGVMLATLPLTGTTPDGADYEWALAHVFRLGGDGLIGEEHFFAIEQWDEALALFDEWSGEPVGL